MAQEEQSTHETSANSPGGHSRIRLQGGEAEEFERLYRRYGVSDGLMRAMGHAFEAHARFGDRGLTGGVRPREVILSLVELGRPQIAREAKASLADELALKSGSLATNVSEARRESIESVLQPGNPTAVTPSRTLVTTLETARRLNALVSAGESLAIRHFVGAYLLNAAEANDASILSKIGLSPESLLEALQSHIREQPSDDLKAWDARLEMAGRGPYNAAGSVGSDTRIQREATDQEIGLDVDIYASVLARLFKHAIGELCFAVFGPWGRGKTVLAQHLAKALRREIPKTESIWFSAWKYPTAPEVWVHLYETFASRAFGHHDWRKLPNVFRTSVAREGYTKLLGIYLGFSFGLMSVFTAINLVFDVSFWLTSLVGLAGIAVAYSAIRSTLKIKSRLSKEYLAPTRHGDKLGLQAVIGKDLEHLLAGWIAPARPGPIVNVFFLAISLVGMLASAHRVHQTPALFQAAERMAGLEVGLPPGPAFATIVCLIYVITAALLYRFLFFGGNPPSRVLLIVDDLDRCDPRHLISVVEAIKLLVEDPVVANKVQVVMLLEEEILQEAIVRKYREAIPMLVDSPNAVTRRRVVQETKEKLFTSHFRLPAISKRDLISLVERFSGFHELRSQQQRRTDEANKTLSALEGREISDRVMVSAGKPGHPFRRGNIRADIPPEAAEPPTPPEYRKKTAVELASEKAELSESIAEAQRIAMNERRELKELVQVSRTRVPNDAGTSVPTAAGVFQTAELEVIISVLDESDELRSHLGPRAIRTFLFRYQLARMLLQAAKVPWSPRAIAEQLSQRMLRPEPKTPLAIISQDALDDPFERVVDQVC